MRNIPPPARELRGKEGRDSYVIVALDREEIFRTATAEKSLRYLMHAAPVRRIEGKRERVTQKDRQTDRDKQTDKKPTNPLLFPSVNCNISYTTQLEQTPLYCPQVNVFINSVPQSVLWGRVWIPGPT